MDERWLRFRYVYLHFRFSILICINDLYLLLFGKQISLYLMNFIRVLLNVCERTRRGAKTISERKKSNNKKLINIFKVFFFTS